jgi:hypothetical protein
LNPVKANLVSRAQDWPYSNYREWIGLKIGDLKDEDFIRSRFPTPKEYEQFLTDDRNEKRDPSPIADYIWD